MAMHFYDKIRLQTVTLRNARDVAVMSFEYHKSVDYLDLSTNEYGLCKRSIFTKEGIRKWMQPERQILYLYNLELPTGLKEYDLNEKFEIVQENAFHHYKVFLCPSVYNHHFEIYVVHEINSQRATNKIEKLRKSMKIIELLNFHRLSTSAMYLYDNILPILMDEGCRDAKLVVDFANLFSFYWWITNRECSHILWYILEAAQKVGSILSLFLFKELAIDVVNSCFFRHKITHVPILLRFGAPSRFPHARNSSVLLKQRVRMFHRAILRRCRSERRAFLLLQLCFDFWFHKNSPEGLRCIWRCINDPFLSLREIASALIPPFRREPVARIIVYYRHRIIGQSCTFETSPRTLKDLCRVEVRRLLNFNHQLPFGVHNLEIPEELKSYLNLFT